MAWLTGYSYRQSVPVANPSSAGNRALDNIPFPAWFLKQKGKITSATYQDVRVTKADGTTVLPHTLNTVANGLYIDFASMPQGRQTVYVYYGMSGAVVPNKAAYLTADRLASGIISLASLPKNNGTLADYGSEFATEGATITSPWSTYGTVQNREYDNSQAAVGSQSVWVKGAADATLGGVRFNGANGSLSTDGCELRFWFRAKQTTQNISLVDYVGSNVSLSMTFNLNGQISIYTDQTGHTGYVQYTNIVGTYNANEWREYRIVFNFTNHTHTISYRTDVKNNWTYLYRTDPSYINIPLRAAGATKFTYLVAHTSNAGEFWIDNLSYKSAAISDTVRLEKAVQVSGTHTEVAFREDIPYGQITAMETASNYTATGMTISVATKTGNKTVVLTHSFINPNSNPLITISDNIAKCGAQSVLLAGTATVYYGQSSTEYGQDGDLKTTLPVSSTNGVYSGIVDGETNIKLRIGGGPWEDHGDPIALSVGVDYTGFIEGYITAGGTTNSLSMVLGYGVQVDLALPTGKLFNSNETYKYKIYYYVTNNNLFSFVWGGSWIPTSVSFYDATPSLSQPSYSDFISNTVQSTGANDERTSEGQTVGTWYLWGDDIDATYIDSALPDNCHNESALHKIGYVPAGSLLDIPIDEIVIASSSGEPTENSTLSVSVYKVHNTTDTLIGAQTWTYVEEGTPTTTKTINIPSSLAMVPEDKLKVVYNLGVSTGSYTTEALGIDYLKAGDLQVHVNSYGTNSYIDEGEQTVIYQFATGITVSGIVGQTVLQESKFHYLLKFFEGGLLKGSIASVLLHLNATSLLVDSNDLLKAYRFKNTKNSPYVYGVSDIATGWGMQTSTPTWNHRLQNYQTGVAEGARVSWLTGGATNANELDTTAESVLSLTTSSSAGYYNFDIDPTWMEDWLNTDYYSQGLMIKADQESTDACCLLVDAPNQNNSPVLEVTYSSYDADQYSKRKVSTSTKWNVHPYAGERAVTIATENSFGAHLSMNAKQRFDIHTFDETGRIFRSVKDGPISSDVSQYKRMNYGVMPFGLHYDIITHRYFIVTTMENMGMTVGYSDPYTPTNWTWKKPPSDFIGLKSGFTVRDGLVRMGIWHYEELGGKVGYLEYDLATDTWSEKVNLVYAKGATYNLRTLSTAIASTDVFNHADGITGLGVIQASGSLEDYRDYGALKIDNEPFWYSGIDRVNNRFTGVWRVLGGSSGTNVPANHSVGSTIHLQDDELGSYVNLIEDEVNQCIHLTHTADITNWIPGVWYTGVFYMRHYYADAPNVWRDSEDNILTLPLNTKTVESISDNRTGAWNQNTLVTDDGTVLSTFGQGKTQNRENGTDAKLARINASGLIEVVDLGIDSRGVNMSSLGGGSIVFLAINANDSLYGGQPRDIYVIRSEDNGHTLSTPVLVASHGGLVGNGLWELAMTTEGNLNGLGMSAYHHWQYYGAVYFQSVEYVMPPASNVVAQGSGNEINITWNDNTTLETAYYIDRSVDGGAYEVLSHTLPVDTSSYIDSNVTNGHTYKYRVAPYDGTSQSDWAESNTASCTTFTPRITIM
ncbi:hypothetical protein HGB25_00310 [Candidatus Saccharibacteria bacterium]|nr:hypothetical protein [Candidatus Saccharibacteria bacterium]